MKPRVTVGAWLLSWVLIIAAFEILTEYHLPIWLRVVVCFLFTYSDRLWRPSKHAWWPTWRKQTITGKVDKDTLRGALKERIATWKLEAQVAQHNYPETAICLNRCADDLVTIIAVQDYVQVLFDKTWEVRAREGRERYLKAEAIIKEYGRHTEECNIQMTLCGPPCTCGFVAAVQSMELEYGRS